MTEMVEVPVDDLRKVLHEHAEFLRRAGIPPGPACNRLEALLPPVRVPVTKHTAWGTPIVSAYGIPATFVGSHPEDPEKFIAIYDGEPECLTSRLWFEAQSEAEAAQPEQVRVPVEVGHGQRVQRRSDGLTGKVVGCDPTRLLVEWSSGKSVWYVRAEVEGWELIQ